MQGKSSCDGTGERELFVRLKTLARALCMVPTKKLDVKFDYSMRCWWLTGCVGGDCVLPQSRGAKTLDEALEFAEAWLAPEMETGSLEEYENEKRALTKEKTDE